MIVGNYYYLRGQLCEVLVQWGPGGGPRNVLVLVGGRKVVRPFRGLRRYRPGQYKLW